MNKMGLSPLDSVLVDNDIDIDRYTTLADIAPEGERVSVFLCVRSVSYLVAHQRFEQFAVIGHGTWCGTIWWLQGRTS